MATLRADVGGTQKTIHELTRSCTNKVFGFVPFRVNSWLATHWLRCGGCGVRASFQLRRDLTHLTRMSGLMSANKQQPLIKINRTEHRMWLDDFAQGQPVTRQDACTKRGSRLFQRSPS